MCEPRPLQVNSSAPAAPLRRRAPRVWARSASRRSSSAIAPSRTCMRTVWPTRTRSPIAIVPGLRVGADDRADEEVAALVVGLVLVDHDPQHQPRRATSSCSRSSSDAIASRSRSIAGRLASSSITLPSAAVIVISGPTGAAPCETQGSIATPDERARDRALVEHVAVAKQRRRAGGRGAREAAEDRQPGPLGVEPRQQRLGREGVRVGEHDQRLAEVVRRRAGR